MSHNGVLLINKEKGMGSTKVVSKVRKALNTRDVGHCGTLDPLAEGLLIVTVGKALKISRFVEADTKEYETTVTLGKETATLDAEGEFINEKEVTAFTKEDILNVFRSLLGKIKQKPPIYSALSKDGKRLYEYARENIEVEIPEREIEIHDLELLNYDNNSITYRVKCSKGTYIRVLNDTIAKALNNIGYTTFLKRTKIGEFNVKDAYTIEEVEANNFKLIAIKDSLPEFNKYYMNDFEYNIIKNGNIFKKYLPGYQLMIDKDGNEIGLYMGDEENRVTKCIRMF